VGAKARITYSNGPFNWYSQGAAMGLVANGVLILKLYRLEIKDEEANQVNFLSGFTYTIGDFQIAPNFLYQNLL
jgi:hypothetical protein